ncbi:MAG: hypothetical protein Q4G64_10200 [bacterium]|nr:hypothetical protein [bacterium]
MIEQVCSARGCRAEAGYALLWRNPRIHDLSRTKIWLACEDHGGTLHEYLASRGFPVEAKPVTELTDDDVAASQPHRPSQPGHPPSGGRGE